MGVLTLDRLTGELSVVRDLSPRAVIIDVVGTSNLSLADIDSVVLAHGFVDFTHSIRGAAMFAAAVFYALLLSFIVACCSFKSSGFLFSS